MVTEIADDPTRTLKTERLNDIAYNHILPAERVV
jgi:hypothetical protein